MDLPMIFTVILSIAMVIVMVVDAVRYIIPNTLNLALLALYPFAAYYLGLDWSMALVAAGIALVVGLGIFALGLMGGGDIKLLVVLVLWTGWNMATTALLMLTAIAGGALVIVVLMARVMLPKLLRMKSPPRILRTKQPVPYGIAIAAAFLWLLYNHQVPGL